LVTSALEQITLTSIAYNVFVSSPQNLRLCVYNGMCRDDARRFLHIISSNATTAIDDYGSRSLAVFRDLSWNWKIEPFTETVWYKDH